MSFHRSTEKEARGTRNGESRQHNLSTILTRLHRSGTHTRTDLVAYTGLNRSTVASLVGELSELGLVIEGSVQRENAVGRPSTVVRASPNVAALVVAPDVDAVEVGLVGFGGRTLDRVRVETKRMSSAKEVTGIALAAFSALLDAASTDTRVFGVAATVPGLVRAQDGVVAAASHLGWVNEDLGLRLSQAFDLPAAVINDGHAGLAAEHIWGAGVGVADLIYVNGSRAGIGGGVLCSSKLQLGRSGFASELGHIRVSTAGELCGCGSRGCLETEVRLERLFTAGDTQSAAVLQHAIQQGGNRALDRELERQSLLLGEALTSLATLHDPETIVLGGFLKMLLGTHDRLLHEVLESRPFAAVSKPVFVKEAELGRDVQLVGGAESIFHSLLQDPSGILLPAPRGF